MLFPPIGTATVLKQQTLPAAIAETWYRLLSQIKNNRNHLNGKRHATCVVVFCFICYMQQMGLNGKPPEKMNNNNVLLIEIEKTNSMPQTRYDMSLLIFPHVRMTHVHTVPYRIFLFFYLTLGLSNRISTTGKKCSQHVQLSMLHNSMSVLIFSVILIYVS